ncbi:MAG: aminotransferase class V-fold PLP-dependent enzyme [Acidobacteria bacterium]|nr:aminotransferase class V-fold PLP-dependent enzyme [Acidobacteriota bacterium]
MYVSTWPGLSPWHLFPSEAAGPFLFPLNASSQRTFFAARYGIYQLFRALRFQKDEVVLVPDYHHGNEVRAIRAAGVKICFYPIRRNLEPDIDQLERLSNLNNARALYVIHYLGWPQPMEELLSLCRRRGMLLIEDCALSLLSESNGKPLGKFGDYSIYCLYKTLPVPNGGLLVQNHNVLPELDRLELQPCGSASLTSRSLELTLEWLRSRYNNLGKALVAFKRAFGKVSAQFGIRRLPMGNSGFDLAHANIGASALSHWLLGHFDYQKIRQQRRFNYQYLAGRLADKATLLRTDLEGGICPLFFPILVPDKHAAARALWQRGIGAVEFWNEGDSEVNPEVFPDSHFLRAHVLELPIHPDVTPPQMDYMADQILRLKLHF